MTSSGRRFEFGACLGRGSFGEVYRVNVRSPGGLETRVAVKLLRADIDLHSSAVRRLRDEGRLLARLNHPSILTVIDLITLEGRIALITEWVDGADLSSFLGEIPPRPLIQALGSVASALAAATQAPGPDGPLQLVHRDIKPSNLRIDRHGQTKLLDFGVASFDASDREVRTASDLVVGSVPYMAPERFIARTVAPSSDIFSLGCCLYEGLTGEPFYGTRKVARIYELAMQPEVYDAFVSERIDSRGWDPVVTELLRDLVRLDASDRPDAREAANRFEEASDTLTGPSLRLWCQQRDWPESRPLEGAMAGRVIDEHPGQLPMLDPPTPAGLPVIQRVAVITVDATIPTASTYVEPPLASEESASTVMQPSSTTDPESPTEHIDRRNEAEVTTAIQAATQGDPEPPTGTLTELRPVFIPPKTAAADAVHPSEGRGLAMLALGGIVLIAAASLAAGGFVFVTVLGVLAVR